MSFKNVIGQAAVKQRLVELVKGNRLSHALLFLGNEGSGALPLALAFAQYVVCEDRSTDACCSCPSCIKAQRLIHPDIHYSYPVIPKKPGDKPVSTDYGAEWREFIGAENKQGNITAQECADILRKLSLKSFESGYKILILWMPEYLGNEGNKLLKLIEEPPADTLFILVAENESLILPTIVSRTQLVKIPALETKDVEEALIDRNETAPGTARQVASVSE